MGKCSSRIFVHVAADRIHLAGDILRRTSRGALEEHVLDKMRDAVSLWLLVPGASLDPDSNRGRTNLLHLLSQNDEAIGQNLTT